MKITLQHAVTYLAHHRLEKGDTLIVALTSGEAAALNEWREMPIEERSAHSLPSGAVTDFILARLAHPKWKVTEHVIFGDTITEPNTHELWISGTEALLPVAPETLQNAPGRFEPSLTRSRT